jgi:hypothetical protein
MVRVIFPNETYYDVIPNFNWDEFIPVKFSGECVFGWFQEVYVCVNKNDYESKNDRTNDDK